MAWTGFVALATNEGGAGLGVVDIQLPATHHLLLGKDGRTPTPFLLDRLFHLVSGPVCFDGPTEGHDRDCTVTFFSVDVDGTRRQVIAACQRLADGTFKLMNLAPEAVPGRYSGQYPADLLGSTTAMALRHRK